MVEGIKTVIGCGIGSRLSYSSSSVLRLDPKPESIQTSKVIRESRKTSS